MSKISEGLARPGRTAGQMSASAAVIEFIDAFGWVTFDGRQYAVSVILLGIVLGTLQVLLENRGVIPAIARTVPPKKVDVVDHAEPEEDVDHV
jgi:hypothetical protein